MPNLFKRVVIALVALGAIAFGALKIANRDDDMPASVPVQDTAQQLERGEALTRAGDCAACHTARGGPPFAGGRGMPTPFGTIYTSNLTSDPDTGIGKWNSDDFWRALHNGKSVDGRLLYPAFPYPNFTKVTRADSDAMYAYIRTVAPVKQPDKPHELRFPYDNPLLLAGWRMLYFRPGVYQADVTKNGEWNRGAYLVQGLGHCGACHTSRNTFGASDTRADLSGGLIPILNWYAPSLSSGTEAGLKDWDAHEIAELLKTGVTARSAVFGPMSEVVYRSLQHLSDGDINAISYYLKALPQKEEPSESEPPRVNEQNRASVLEQGARLYETNCEQCHQANGAGAPTAYPPLAGNRAITMRSAVNSIRIVLNGGFPPGTAGNPRPYGMPPFGPTLTDNQVAALVSYIRNSWGNHAGLVSPLEVRLYRSAPLE